MGPSPKTLLIKGSKRVEFIKTGSGALPSAEERAGDMSKLQEIWND